MMEGTAHNFTLFYSQEKKAIMITDRRCLRPQKDFGSESHLLIMYALHSLRKVGEVRTQDSEQKERSAIFYKRSNPTRARKTA